MTMMTATYPGMSENPTRDSEEIRHRELGPIVERLQAALRDLERYADAVDYDDDGHHGD
jgi:hypothetical protein